MITDVDQFVTVTPTIMDGTVVRWYPSEDELLYRGRERISASRNGVTAPGGWYVSPEQYAAAWDVHQAIKRGEDVRHLATHKTRGIFGPYERVDVAS